MKHPADKFTADLFGEKRRGRPPKFSAKSNVQRQREFRERRKFNFLTNSKKS